MEVLIRVDSELLIIIPVTLIVHLCQNSTLKTQLKVHLRDSCCILLAEKYLLGGFLEIWSIMKLLKNDNAQFTSFSLLRDRWNDTEENFTKMEVFKNAINRKFTQIYSEKPRFASVSARDQNMIVIALWCIHKLRWQNFEDFWPPFADKFII